jgi:hypothetical protein
VWCSGVLYCIPCCMNSVSVIVLSLLSFLSKRANGITFLSVCPLYQLFIKLVELYVIQYGGHSIEGDLDPIILNPIASTIPKWLIFKLLRWMQNLHQLTWNHEILYDSRWSEAEQLITRPLLWKIKYTNMASSQNLKFMFYLMETTHEPIHLDKKKNWCDESSWTYLQV